MKTSTIWSLIGVAFVIFVVWLGGAPPSSQGEPQGQPVTSLPVNECLHTSAVHFSDIENSRMKEIMVSVMQGDINMPTIAIYNEFWSTMFSHGRLCQEDLTLTRDGLALASECNKLFYQDALISLHTKEAYKSSERLNCEDKTRVKANAELMLSIATGQPIRTANGSVVFTEEVIQTSLNDINKKLEGLDRLFSSIAPPEPVSKQPVLGSSTPEDKSCEATHGPSVYVLNPASTGGGAWCDCKPGYESKLISTADGPSSWCFKK